MYQIRIFIIGRAEWIGKSFATEDEAYRNAKEVLRTGFELNNRDLRILTIVPVHRIDKVEVSFDDSASADNSKLTTGN